MLTKEEKQELDKKVLEMVERISRAHEHSLLRWFIVPLWKSITFTSIFTEIIIIMIGGRAQLFSGLVIPTGIIAAICWFKARRMLRDLDRTFGT